MKTVMSRKEKIALAIVFFWFAGKNLETLFKATPSMLPFLESYGLGFLFVPETLLEIMLAATAAIGILMRKKFGYWAGLSYVPFSIAMSMIPLAFFGRFHEVSVAIHPQLDGVLTFGFMAGVTSFFVVVQLVMLWRLVKNQAYFCDAVKECKDIGRY